MKTEAKVTLSSGGSRLTLKVETAYSPEFVKLARSLKGKWDPRARAWFFGSPMQLFDGLVALFGAEQVDWCGSNVAESQRALAAAKAEAL